MVLKRKFNSILTILNMKITEVIIIVTIRMTTARLSVKHKPQAAKIT